MTNTKDEAKPSETPEKQALNELGNDALPNTEKNDKMNPSRNRSMWGNQNPKCDINSETRHPHEPTISPNLLITQEINRHHPTVMAWNYCLAPTTVPILVRPRTWRDQPTHST